LIAHDLRPFVGNEGSTLRREYYAWRGRPESPRKTANRALLTFGMIKTELVHHVCYPTREAARHDLYFP
jgi:hypothetical protein